MDTSLHQTPVSLSIVLAALLAWGLAAALAFNLLGGPLVERSCQTGCVQILALASLLVAVVGLLLGYRRPRHWLTQLAALACLALLGIYLTIFFIGTLTG